MTSDEIKLLDFFVYSPNAKPDVKLYFSTSELISLNISNNTISKLQQLLVSLQKNEYIKNQFEITIEETYVTVTNKGFQFIKADKTANKKTKRTQNKYREHIHDLVVQKFIKKRYQDVDLNTVIFEKYNDLFKLFTKIVNDESKEYKVNNLFEFIAEKVNETSNENFIKILGPDGAGKSTFLSVLYIYLYNCFQNGSLRDYPFYINLHYYDSQVIEGRDIDELNQKVREGIQEDLKDLIELSQKEKHLKFLIIIDGNEKYKRSNLDAKSILQKFLKKIKGHKKIISIGEKTNVHSMRERDEKRIYDDQTAYAFQFSPIYINEEKKWCDVIEKYCILVNKQNQIDNMIKCIYKFNIKEVDFNLLTILGECSKNCSIKDIDSISELYSKYCLDYLNDIKNGMETSIKLSYTYFMTVEHVEQNYISKHWKEWELVHQHKTISNYLLACYYAQYILKKDFENINKFKCVFTNGINIFLKSILNETKKNQKTTLEFCNFAFCNGDYRVQAQAAYLAGRVQNEELQEKAKTLLKNQLDKWNLRHTKADSQKREQYFLKRSIMVSLLNLGVSSAGSRLLADLFNVSLMNEVNRAFYLQYYDDVKSEPEIINLKDDGKAPITYTTSVLLNYIYNKLCNNSENLSLAKENEFQIHVFTFCSLVHKRWEQGIETGLLDSLKNIISLSLNNGHIHLNENMRIYLQMLEEDICDNKAYEPSHLYNELYHAKDIQREGWLKKIKKGSICVKQYENIIEHTYFSWLLGMLYLPNKRPDSEGDEYNNYDKRKILDCLLIHDLAETYEGDKLPEENTEEHKIAENKSMLKIFMHDKYSDISSMTAYRNVWKNFKLDSRDINGKIAKEIDIIQAIYQFCIYKRQGAVFEGKKEEEWLNEPRKIETEVSRKILNEVVLKNFPELFQKSNS